MTAITTLSTRGGVCASVEEVDGQDQLTVHAADGRVVLRVTEDGALALVAHDGDLRLAATNGRVCLEGANGVEVKGPVIVLQAVVLRQVADRLEIRARRIVEHAKDVYRNVEGVSHTRAGQLKFVAKKTARIVAERLRMRAKKDAKLQGDKIYLG